MSETLQHILGSISQDSLPFPQLCAAMAECSPQPMVAVEGKTHLVRYVNPALRLLLGPAPYRSNRPHSRSPRRAFEKRLMNTTLATTGIPGLHHILWGGFPANRLQARRTLRAEIAGHHTHEAK